MPRVLVSNRVAVQNRFRIRDFGSSVFINAGTNNIDIPADPALQPGSGSFAVSLWFKPQELLAGTHALIQQNPTTYSAGYFLNQTGNGLAYYVNSGGPLATVSNFFGGMQYRWHMITLVADASQGRVYLYRNAELVSSTAASWNITANVGVRVGSNPQFGSATITGNVDDVIFWKGTIPDHLNGGIARLYYDGIVTGAVARYRLNENTGTSALDSVGTNNGTITGATWSSDIPLALRQTLPSTQNLFSYSENLVQGDWTKGIGVTAILSNDVPPPDTGGVVSRVVYDGSGAAGGSRVAQSTPVGFYPGPGYFGKSKIKLRTLSGSVSLVLRGNGLPSNGYNITVSNTWQVFEGVFKTTTGFPGLILSSPTGDNTPFTIYATEAQFNYGPQSTAYYKTTTTVVGTNPPRAYLFNT